MEDATIDRYIRKIVRNTSARYIYAQYNYERFRASNFIATNSLSFSLFYHLFTRLSSAPTVLPSYYTPSPPRRTSSPLADWPDYLRSDRTTNSAQTSISSPPSAPDSTDLELCPCTTSRPGKCLDGTFLTRTSRAARSPGTRLKTSTVRKKSRLPTGSLAGRKSSPTRQTGYHPSAEMPSSPVRVRWFAWTKERQRRHMCLERREASLSLARERPKNQRKDNQISTPHALCFYKKHILTSGGSTRIDRRSDCRRKHADALFGLEPSDVFFADPPVVGVGVDVVVVVVVVVVVAPRRPLILMGSFERFCVRHR